MYTPCKKHLLSKFRVRDVCNLFRYLTTSVSDSLYGGETREQEPTTLKSLQEKYERGVALTAVTAYDYPSAMHVSNSILDVFYDHRFVLGRFGKNRHNTSRRLCCHGSARS
jgi:hypothetical protein